MIVQLGYRRVSLLSNRPAGYPRIGQREREDVKIDEIEEKHEWGYWVIAAVQTVRLWNTL